MPLHKPRPVDNIYQLNMLPISTLFNGIYRVDNNKTGTYKNGSTFAYFDLHDATGVKKGQCHPNEISWYQSKPFELVKVKGFVLHSDNQKLVHVTEIMPVKVEDIIDSIKTLPRALCEDATWLDRLISIRQSIHSPALGKFMDTIFSDNDIALSFLQVPASKSFHHNHIGGLLAHSIEVAEITGNQLYESTDERDIAVVAALLHDIGKVKTLKPDKSTTQLGKMVGHDDLTLEICANALKDLDKTWSEASYTMRHVWTCASSGAKYGFERNCLIANIVQFADRQSVDHFNEKLAFESNNKVDGLAWNGNKYFWRPTAESRSINWRTKCLKSNTH